MTTRLIVTGRNSRLPQDVAQMTGGAIARRFNPVNAEQALREHLDGKFFAVTGEDINERRRRDEAERLKTKAPPTNREKMRAHIAAMRQARQQLMERRRTGNGYSVRLIIAAVAAAHNIDVADMVSETRAYPATRARQHAYWLIRKLMEKPFPDIASYFNRDHSTVVHGCAIWPERAPDYQREIAAVNAMLGITDDNPIPA